MDADTSPCGSEDATPGSRACVRARALLGRVGRAGLPGAFWCASPFPVAALSLFFVWAPPGLGRPVCCVCVFFLLFFARPRCLLGLGVLFAPSPLFYFFLFFCFSFPPLPLFFFLLLGVLFPAFLFVFLSRSVCCFVLFLFFVFGCVVRCRFVCFWLWVVLVCDAVGAAVCGALCVLPGAVWRACAWLGSGALPSGAVLRLVLLGCFCCVLLSRAAVFSAAFFFCVGPCLSVVVPPVLVCVVLGRGVSCCLAWPCCVAFLCWLLLRCAVWCSAVPWCVSWFRAVLFVSLRCFGGVLPRPLLWRVVVLCLSLGAVLCRPAVLPVVRVLSFLVPFFCVLLGLAVLCCLLVAPGVVFWWCCPCLAVWLAALWFGVVCLGAPLRCVVFCGAVLSRGGVLSCPAVCLSRCLCLLFVSWRCAFCCVCPGVLPCGWSACCGALLPCVVSCGAVPSCGAALSCSGVFLRRRVCLLSLLVSCFGGAVSVWPCGSPPCGLVWCVWLLCSAVLCSVVLSCRVLVCCRVLLSVCVVACACCLFSGAALSAACVLVCFPVVGRLVVAPCSPVLCPVVLCCRVALRCRVLVSVCSAVCACRRFFPLKPLQNPLKKNIFF